MRITLISLALLFSGISFAQDADDDSSRRVIYKQRTEIDFEGIELKGELVKPMGSLINARRSSNFNPLITLRVDFNDKISQSVDEIK
jgi:hypothetical protein